MRSVSTPAMHRGDPVSHDRPGVRWGTVPTGCISLRHLALTGYVTVPTTLINLPLHATIFLSSCPVVGGVTTRVTITPTCRAPSGTGVMLRHTLTGTCPLALLHGIPFTKYPTCSLGMRRLSALR
eukprot:Sspe_Gene.104328::Locus_80415_Transcript_1_1_Confidence_1.000_Length_845::g.104328::m.104328